MAEKWSYGVNQYDSDGDVVDEGIYFFWGDISVKVAESINDLNDLMKSINGNILEIEEECQRVGL